MLGFAVTLVIEEIKRVASEQYEVADDGSIVFTGGGSVVDRFAPGEWMEVNSIGIRLSETWPPPELALEIDTVAERLGVHYGHYVHALRDLDRFESWRMNELEDLTTAVFTAIGDEDPHASESQNERSDVRDLIARGFGVRA
ncbi:MAG: hypothetical protein GY724_05085 [Actinomycetia bacterium]|nr:hypothetical protein [Actinomycetes bacterium]MCP5031817.1 hypothetical protein [Actinomycetes bacterium]